MMASSSAPQQQPLSSLSNTNELRSLNRNVVTAYLQPLLSKHDTKTIMTYEDLTASLEAAMRVWKSDATVEDTKQKEAVVRTEFLAWARFLTAFLIRVYLILYGYGRFFLFPFVSFYHDAAYHYLF